MPFCAYGGFGDKVVKVVSLGGGRYYLDDRIIFARIVELIAQNIGNALIDLPGNKERIEARGFDRFKGRGAVINLIFEIRDLFLDGGKESRIVALGIEGEVQKPQLIGLRGHSVVGEGKLIDGTVRTRRA